MRGEENLVAETAARLFADLATHEVARAADERGRWPEVLWQAVEDAGFVVALEPESGVTLPEALAILRASGRHPTPIPLAETMLARSLAMRVGFAPPDGPLSIGIAGEAERLRLEGQALHGVLPRVAFARQARAVVVFAQSGQRTMVVLAPIEPAQISHGRNLAGEPRDDVRYGGATLPDGAIAPAPRGIDEAWLLRMGALLRSAQMVGALEAALAISVTYANERKQFGRSIGKFQAIQHQLAAVGGEVAASTAMLDVAVEAVAVDAPHADLAVAAAKARAGEAAGIAAAIAHQVHGAIGFTREYALQGLTRRLLSWRDEYGAEAYWQSYLGRDVLGANAGPLWAHLAAV